MMYSMSISANFCADAASVAMSMRLINNVFFIFMFPFLFRMRMGSRCGSESDPPGLFGG